MKALFVGDITLDLSLVAPRLPEADEKVHCDSFYEGVGGVVTNAAVAYSKAGSDASLVVQIGDDQASARALESLKASTLDLHVAGVPGAMGRVVTLLEPHGEKRLLLVPGVSLFPSAEVVDAIDFGSVSHLHTACFGPACHALIDRARRNGISWSIDLEPASFANGLSELADVIDGAEVIFCNDRAAELVGGDAPETLLEHGAISVVRTKGPAGASCHRRGEEVVSASVEPGMPVRDTTGAGDCLAGWYLAGRSRGKPVEYSLKLAVKAASYSCRALGSLAFPTPHLVDVQNWGQK